jgi:threonyl-tRNA synthetase
MTRCGNLKGISALAIARSISEGWPQGAGSRVNGQVWDATRPIPEDATPKLLTWNDNAGKNTFIRRPT